MPVGKNPHVTILMTTYNGEQYLGETIESLLQQDYDNWNLVISDDGSNDTTVAVIEDYIAAYPGKIRRFISGKHFGSACRHFMYLLENIMDDYIMFCDQDDMWHRDKISITMQKMLAIEAGEDIPVLVHTDFRVMSESMQVISDSFFEYSGIDYEEDTLPELIVQNVVSGCTAMINRALAEAALMYKNIDSVVMYDWWLGLCAVSLGRIAVIDTATMDYRWHHRDSIGKKGRYSVQYVLKKIVAGDIKNAIARAITQGSMLGECFGDFLSTENLTVCNACRMIEKMGKPVRIKMYKKYGLMPHGILRKLKMIIWG